jgi:hypothetical protein
LDPDDLHRQCVSLIQDLHDTPHALKRSRSFFSLDSIDVSDSNKKLC